MRIVRWITMTLFAVTAAAFILSEIVARTGKDTTPPVIVSERDEISVLADSPDGALFAGITASDSQDGDLTDDLFVGSHSRFLEPGVCNVTYVVFDKSNNVAQYTRKVTYEGYVPPRFSLSEPLTYGLSGEGGQSILSRLSAHDVLDGDITDRIRLISSNVDFAHEGTYYAEAEVSNSYGDVARLELPVTVTGRPAGGPVITLTDYLVDVEQSVPFDPSIYVAGVTDGAGTPVDPGTVTYGGNVNTDVPGIYVVTCSAADGAGVVGTVNLTVVVYGQ